MSIKQLQDFDIIQFKNQLIAWYEKNKRDLPWRKTNDPYKIWVSEIMLQQTKVDTVIPYFNRFITKFPTVYHLAEADEQTVLKEWEGLGYYTRAKNLHHAVREIVEEYNGEVPRDPVKLSTLKGIGPYTKGAVLSIAFNQPEPAVDGNVMRVFSRLLEIEEDIAIQRTKKQFEEIVRNIIPKDDPSTFNQAIMELGALICTPRKPKCEECPVQKYCEAFQNDKQSLLPIKGKAKKKTVIPYVVLLIKNKKNELAIVKRPSTGLLANMWQFPMVPINEVGKDHIEHWVYGEYGIKVLLNKKVGKLKHVFSHLIWQLEVYHAELAQIEKKERIQFVTKDHLNNYPFPVSHLNIMKYI